MSDKDSYTLSLSKLEIAILLQAIASSRQAIQRIPELQSATRKLKALYCVASETGRACRNGRD